MDNFRIKEKNTWNVITCSTCQYLISDYTVLRTRKELPEDLMKLPQIRKHIKEDRHQSKLIEEKKFAQDMLEDYLKQMNPENQEKYSQIIRDYAARIEFYDKYIIKE